MPSLPDAERAAHPGQRIPARDDPAAEHGGFYDRVAPPTATDDHPDFRRLSVHFDHTSIMKTTFTCVCRGDGQIPAMSARAAAANPPRELTDFQNGFYEMARLLRRAGLPGGHP